jgi:hypothetical protein
MKLFDVEQSAQSGLVNTGTTTNTNYSSNKYEGFKI